MIKNLIKLANSLDDRGYRKEADDLDSIIRRLASKDFEDYDELFDILKDEKPTLTHTGRPIEEPEPAEVEESSYSMRGFPDDDSQFQDYEDEDEIAERLEEEMKSFIKREIVDNPEVLGQEGYRLFDIASDPEDLKVFSEEVLPEKLAIEFKNFLSPEDALMYGSKKTNQIVLAFDSVGKSLDEYYEAREKEGGDSDLVYIIDVTASYLRQYLEE